jgi:hypothetical protein
MIDARTAPAWNVIAGWLGWPVPQLPRQRNKSRAAYRKTDRKRTAAPGVQRGGAAS